MSFSKLPIYKKSRDLLQHTVICVKEFPRDYRDNFGKLMIEHAMSAFILICEANPLNYSGKIAKLDEAEIAVKTLDNFFHASFDMRFFMGMKKKARAMELTANLLDDIKRWRRYNVDALTKKKGC